MDLNKVQLTGRLGGEPELKTVAGGARIARLRLANSRRARDEQGAAGEQTDWYTLTAWNGLAEICARICQTGDLVYAEGRLRVSQWEDRDGARRTRVEVVLDQLQLLARSRPRDEAGAPMDEEEVPF